MSLLEAYCFCSLAYFGYRHVRPFLRAKSHRIRSLDAFFLQACKDGDTEKARELVLSKADVHCKNAVITFKKILLLSDERSDRTRTLLSRWPLSVGTSAQ